MSALISIIVVDIVISVLLVALIHGGRTAGKK